MKYLILQARGYMPGKTEFARPYNSAAGIPEDVSWVIFVTVMIIAAYIFFRVRRDLKGK